MSPDLGHLREDYLPPPLRRADLATEPVAQFERWWDEWIAGDPFDAAACILATADEQGRPSARFVLCRGFDRNGFVVYTNQESRKGRELTANPWASLVFGWLPLHRQVRVEGPVDVVDDATADAYWATRPRGSQIGAWASSQSDPVASREDLDRRAVEAAARFGGVDGTDPVPRPPHWSGYRIGVERLELWQGRPDRLHDRFEYRRDPTAPGGWRLERLQP